MAERHVTLGGPVTALAFSCVGALFAAAKDGVCHLEPVGDVAGAGGSQSDIYRIRKSEIPVTKGVGTGN